MFPLPRGLTYDRLEAGEHIKIFLKFLVKVDKMIVRTKNPIKIFGEFFQKLKRRRKFKKLIEMVLKEHKTTLERLAKYEREHPES